MFLKRIAAFIIVLTVALWMDHLLAQQADKRFDAEDYGFWSNYDPSEINWDNEDWEKCWGDRKLLFYKYQACIRGMILPDPSIEAEHVKVFIVYAPNSVIGAIKDEISLDSSAFGFADFKEVFYLFPDPRIERLTGKIRSGGGVGAVRSRNPVNLPDQLKFNRSASESRVVD